MIDSDRAKRLLRSGALALGGVLWPGPEQFGPPRLRRRLPWLTGLYAVIVCISAAGAELNDSRRMVGGVAFLLMLPLIAGLALAGRRPLDGWRLVTLWLLVLPFLVPPPAPPVPPLEAWAWCLWVPALLLAGIGRPGRSGADAVAVGGVGLLVLIALSLLTPWPVDLGYLGLSVGGMLVPLLVGASIGARLNSRRALAREQAKVAQAQAERGAMAERARIAREMHDVVAHHMSMIAVRCETAPYRLTGLNEAGQAEIAEIGAAARAAMADMQGLLGVLRTTESGAAADLAPQPSLEQVTELVERARAAGLAVTATLDDGLDRVPRAVGLSAYRIAQEALTNARKHAPRAPTTLSLRHTAAGLELVVRSGPGAERTRPAPGGGHGLAGMRERAALHGGELAAGPDPDGGFAVRAVLPWRA